VLYYERKFKRKGYNLIIGVDEVGRGPLAGPVMAAAVSLRTARFKSRIDDSKKLTPFQREHAFGEIVNKSVFGIGIINERVIDRLNIQVATRMAMEEAISRLIHKLKTNHRQRIYILVDGNIKLDIDLPFTNIIKGDSKSKSIACASILAKVIRDRIMDLYDRLYPQYGFKKHKGYPTKRHRTALKRFGPSLIHRKSFSGV
jgi:ribonuclease HII